MATAPMRRVWAFLSEEEAGELKTAASERGLKSSVLVRIALMQYLRRPVLQDLPEPTNMALDRLETIAANLDRYTKMIGRAVPVIEDAWAEHEIVRGLLTEIAVAVGASPQSTITSDAQSKNKE